ncbi:M23 family metallopeptidase [Staphylococcus caprae]|uniref:M23 family metallopeptidase n=1 Tax=Staphylococcus caprae TaxID=29380 RepID=UPI000E68B044|nr:M23 family metallopeptidase [Staphylococcus caprae]MDK6298369.1 M23 family metallopeptidase [Staphylococcus caprae]MDK7233827.1 M23 family metallopeptidase [Staphylococcus caprae]RIM32930.1 M23 family peptidase [Staphylococcus caprae]
MNLNRLINLIENKKHNEIYKLFSKSMKKSVSKRMLKETLDLYMKFAKKHKLYVDIGNASSGEKIWLDEYQNYGVFVLIEDDVIHSLILKPLYYFKDKWTQLTYNLPIKDEWLVYWGGDNELFNYHYNYETQRYAYDLVKLVNGKTMFDGGQFCTNYYSFGADVVAPIYGEVVRVVNHVNDNTPGNTNENEPFGNYVMIKHDRREYSVLAHLKRNSITVREGDIIYSQEVVGQCGNSGNSSEPHLHFQVINAPDLEKGQSLKIKFENATQPIKGEILKN